MQSTETTTGAAVADTRAINPILSYLRADRTRRTDAEWLDAVLLAWSRWLGYLAESGQESELGPIPAEYSFTPRSFGAFGPAYDDIEDALDAIRHTGGTEEDLWCAECEIAATSIRQAARVLRLLVIADQAEAVAA